MGQKFCIEDSDWTKEGCDEYVEGSNLMKRDFELRDGGYFGLRDEYASVSLIGLMPVKYASHACTSNKCKPAS